MSFNTKPRLVDRLNAIDCVDSGNFENLKDLYFNWVNYDEMGLWCKSVINDPFIPIEFYKSPLSKRGNFVYKRKFEYRLKGINRKIENIEFFNYKNVSMIQKTKALFITVTFPHEKCSSSWIDLGKRWNIYLSVLKKKFIKSIWYLGLGKYFKSGVEKFKKVVLYHEFRIFRTFESHEDGFPHIHCLMIFKDLEFDCFYNKGGVKMNNGKLSKPSWRIFNKKDFESESVGLVDVLAINSIVSGIGYVVKYIRKLIDKVKEDSENLLTLSLLWAFRKKSYGISGKFVDLISALRISSVKADTVQTRFDLEDIFGGFRFLFGGVVSVLIDPQVVWSLRGFCSGLVDKFTKISYEEYRELCSSSSFSPFKGKSRYVVDDYI